MYVEFNGRRRSSYSGITESEVQQGRVEVIYPLRKCRREILSVSCKDWPYAKPVSRLQQLTVGVARKKVAEIGTKRHRTP